MPTYTFECKKCGNFEIVQSIAEYKPQAECPHCHKVSHDRAYDADTPVTTVRLADCEIRTLGHLAERNSEKFSDDYKAELHRKHNAHKYGGKVPLRKNR